MGLQTFNDFVARVGNGFFARYPIYGNVPATTSTILSVQSSATSLKHKGFTRTLPTLPTGVTAYIPTLLRFMNSINGALLVGRITDLGKFDISGTGTFTDGSAMPTVTECGVSRSVPSAIFGEITTALSFGSTCTITVSYTNQSGGASSTAAISLTTGSVVGSVGYCDLQTGDSGCVDITNVTRGGSPTTPSGVVQFWGMIPLSMITVAQSRASVENLMSTLAIQRVSAGEKIAVFEINNNSTGAFTGDIFIVGDN